MSLALCWPGPASSEALRSTCGTRPGTGVCALATCIDSPPAKRAIINAGQEIRNTDFAPLGKGWVAGGLLYLSTAILALLVVLRRVGSSRALYLQGPSSTLNDRYY